MSNKISTRKLVGRRFGHLLVISFSEKSHHGFAIWDCMCECGIKMAVYEGLLLSGRVSSCGYPNTEGHHA